MRRCEQCGVKLPPFLPRKRDPETGKLLCRGCRSGKPGFAMDRHANVGNYVSTIFEFEAKTVPYIERAAALIDKPFHEQVRDTVAQHPAVQHVLDAAMRAGVAAERNPHMLDTLHHTLRLFTGARRTEGVGDPEKVRSFQGRDIPQHGSQVAVYRDLSDAPRSGFGPHESFSVKRVGPSGGRSSHVYAHTTGVHLTNASPVFDEAARRKAMESGKRGVHAYAHGTVSHYPGKDFNPKPEDGWRPVSYYPDTGKFFLADNRNEWKGSNEAVMSNGKMHVRGEVREGAPVPYSKFEHKQSVIAHPDDFVMSIISAKPKSTLEWEYPDGTKDRMQSVRDYSHAVVVKRQKPTNDWEAEHRPEDSWGVWSHHGDHAKAMKQKDTIPSGHFKEVRIVPVKKVQAMKTVAHDSGDGQTIYHCPFCGAGQVLGMSDGTTECQFCNQRFTVQVQPTVPAMPQTIDGQPYPIPGMPGEYANGDGNEGNPAMVDAVEGQDGAAPVDDQQAPPANEKKDDKPPWLKGGGLLPERDHITLGPGVNLTVDDYQRRLALAVAGPNEKQAVLAKVRAEHLASRS